MRGWQVMTGAGDSWAPPAPSDAAVQALLPPANSAIAPLQWPPVVSTGLGGPSNRESRAGGHDLQRALSGSPTRSAQHGSLAPYFGTSPTSAFTKLLQDPASRAVGGLLPIQESLPALPNADQLLLQLQAAHAAEQEARQAAELDGHSSGHSGGGHVDPINLQDPVKKESETSSIAAGRQENRQPGGAGRALSFPAPSSYHLRTRSSSLRAAWVERSAEEEEAEERGGAEAADEDASASEPGAAGGSATTEDDTPVAAHRKGSQDSRSAKPATKLGIATRGVFAKPTSSGGGEAAKADGSGGSGQKRLGRPVVYKGDPDAPDLTDAERRKIKRRIANRESARRVRAKRAELMDELQIKVAAQSQQNARLASHAAVLESQRNMMLQQVALLQQKLSQKSEENVALYNQLYQLRRLLPPEVVAQAERDAAAATPPPSSPMQMRGSGAGLFVPVTPQSCGGTGAGAGEDPFSADTHGMGFL